MRTGLTVSTVAHAGLILVALAGPLLVASSPALCAAAMEICPFAFS